jgi:hypothetical protein
VNHRWALTRAAPPEDNLVFLSDVFPKESIFVLTALLTPPPSRLVLIVMQSSCFV